MPRSSPLWAVLSKARAGRHPMLGGLWQRGVPATARRAAVTDEEARARYLGGGLVSAEGVRLGLPA